MTNPFRSSNRAQMNSNAITDQNQGGGAKKAGFPYIVGRTSWTNIAFNMTNVPGKHCAQLKCLNTTKLPLACVSRGIGSDVRVISWRCPATKK